jgi:hypothetical protein
LSSGTAAMTKRDPAMDPTNAPKFKSSKRTLCSSDAVVGGVHPHPSITLLIQKFLSLVEITISARKQI